MSIDAKSKVTNGGSKGGRPFEKHHVLQDAVMKGAEREAYSSSFALAIPLMGGNWLKGSPHHLATNYQRANVSKPILEVAEGSLKAAGCKQKDIDLIMDAVKAWTGKNEWPLP